jgi:hypothetical protein
MEESRYHPGFAEVVHAVFFERRDLCACLYAGKSFCSNFI